MAATAQRSPKEEWDLLLPVFASCNLAKAKKAGMVDDAVSGRCELGVNLDQDVCHTPHIGKHLPCILASTSHMWGVSAGRPFTGKDRPRVTISCFDYTCASSS